ncbi:hypothetical protein FHG87_013491 [Trinorchestia longiramus]|nr:hypothetical protein FHG87_013491 [Trinorchestia longiramus]
MHIPEWLVTSFDMKTDNKSNESDLEDELVEMCVDLEAKALFEHKTPTEYWTHFQALVGSRVKKVEKHWSRLIIFLTLTNPAYAQYFALCAVFDVASYKPSNTWEVLDLGGDEETRQSATGLILSSLYEVVKLAYLKPSSAAKDQSLPRAVCSAAHGMVCVTLDCTLLLFAENCSTLVLQLLLPHAVGTVVWLGSPNFLIATDCSGQLHFIHVPSQRLLITRQLAAAEGAGGCESTLLSAHCQLLADGGCTLLFVTSSGHLLRVSNLHLERIEDSLARGCLAELVEAEQQLTFDCLPLTNSPLVCAAGVVGGHESQVLLWGVTSDGVVFQQRPLQDHLLDKDDEDGSSSEGGAGKEVLVNLPFVCSKLLPVASGRYLLVLSETGALTVVCTCTGVTKTCGPAQAEEDSDSHPGRVVDAVLLPWTDGCKDPQLLLLVDPGAHDASWLLRIVALPGQC